MANKLYTGVLGTATVTGTGDYTGIANVTGYRTWASVADGDAVDALVKSGLGTFEYVKLTKSGGATPVLARTTIRRQSDGSTNPVSWPTNTAVEIYSSVGAENIAALDSENVFLQHQHLAGKRLTLDDSKTSYFQSNADGEFDIYVGGTKAGRIYKSSGKPIFQWYWADSGASAGPNFNFFRDSSSPAVGDQLGRIQWDGNDSTGAARTYARMQAYVVDPNGDSLDGGISFSGVANGNVVDLLALESGRILIGPTGLTTYCLVQKAGSGINIPGVEITDRMYLTYSGTAPLVVNRTTSDGMLIDFLRDGGSQGSIGVASGVVSLTGACLTHPSEWAAGEVEPEDLRGLVVRAADGVLADASGAHPLVRPTRQIGDPAVYGVITGRAAWTLADGTEIQALQVAASGTALIRVVGRVRLGDLLESSDVPGCAQAQRDDIVRARTVAKATQSSPDTGEPRLVACTVMAGG